jgi:hypothetical protein
MPAPRRGRALPIAAAWGIYLGVVIVAPGLGRLRRGEGLAEGAAVTLGVTLALALVWSGLVRLLRRARR